MIVKIQRKNQVLWIVLIMYCIAFAGCSSVHVTANQAPKADDTYEKTVWALWWGASDPVESVDCNGNGLQFVTMKTNWIYSLCTFVTLGAVVPVDIEYRCTSEPLHGGDIIGEIRGVKP